MITRCPWLKSQGQEAHLGNGSHSGEVTAHCNAAPLPLPLLLRVPSQRAPPSQPSGLAPPSGIKPKPGAIQMSGDTVFLDVAMVGCSFRPSFKVCSFAAIWMDHETIILVK